MSELKIVALDGSLSQPLGWAIPLVQDGDVVYRYGETRAEGFSAGRLSELADSGDIHLVEPVTIPSMDDSTEVDDRWACRPFGAPLMALYWDDSKVEDLGNVSQWKKVVRQNPRGQLKSSGNAADLRLRLLSEEGLILCLRMAVDAISQQFRQKLSDHLQNNQDNELVCNNEQLQMLADMAYRLAPDKSWAKSAIAQKTLLLLSGDHPESVPAWLAAVTPFWEHPPDLKFWTDAANAFVAAVEQLLEFGRLQRKARRASQPESEPNIIKEWSDFSDAERDIDYLGKSSQPVVRLNSNTQQALSIQRN